MATVSELVTKHSKVPGDIKVRHCTWPKMEWARPYFQTRNGIFHGLNEDDNNIWLGTDNNFELYVEPKRKVKRAQYLLEWQNCRPEVTSVFFVDDDDVRRCFNSNLLIRLTRLTETEREFDK